MESATRLYRDPYDDEVRYRLLQELRGKPLQQSREQLFAALGDSSWRVRKQAVELLLAARPDRDDLHALVSLQRDDENAGLRNAVAELLVRLGSAAVPVLVLYLHDPDPDLRKQVVDALGLIGGPEAVAGLQTALADNDINVASAAAEGLGQAGATGAADALFDALQRKQDLFFSFTVLSALQRIGVPCPLPPLFRRLVGVGMLQRSVYACLGTIGADLDAFELLLQGLEQPQTALRQAALCSLAQVLERLPAEQQQKAVKRLELLADQGLFELLHELVQQDGQELHQAAISLLSHLSDPRGAGILLCALLDERLVSKARAALKKLGEQAVVAAIERFAETGDPAERAVLCSFLGWQGDQRGSSALQQGLHDPAPQVRAAAAAAVAGLHDQALHQQLVNLLDDGDSSVRNAALTALRSSASLDAAQAAAVAARMVQSGRPEQRRAAAQLYAGMQDSSGLACLLNDEDPSVREAAARAAGTLAREQGCLHLVTALADEDPDVRIAAAESLGICGDQSILPSLRLALQDVDSWVQAAVLRSLVSLAGTQVLPDLLSCWEQGDEIVQLACLEAAEQLAAPDQLLQALSRGLGSRDGEVLKRAVNLLSRYNAALLAPWMQHVLAHQDWDVRICAVRACRRLPAEERRTLLRLTLDREDNDLVRSEIRALLQEQ